MAHRNFWVLTDSIHPDRAAHALAVQVEVFGHDNTAAARIEQIILKPGHLRRQPSIAFIPVLCGISKYGLEAVFFSAPGP
jgi:hypothetical protein